MSSVIDIASRRVTGYALADHLRIEFIADALANAITARRPDPGVVFQSDRGCQYVSAASPTWPGTASSPCPSGAPASAGTALAESFFARIEGELNDTQPWPVRPRGGPAAPPVEYIGWYNVHPAAQRPLPPQPRRI